MESDDWCIVSRSGSTTSTTSLSKAQIILREGFLLKRGQNIKNWRRRYFILYNDGKLLGFEGKPQDKHYINPNNNFIVRECNIIKRDEPKDLLIDIYRLILFSKVPNMISSSN